MNGLKHIGFVSRAPEQTRRFGELIGARAGRGDLLLLEGAFGAGKTTFVQGLAAGLGAGGRVTSPSFTLVNEYRGRIPLFHVDLFRLERLDLEIEQAIEDCEGGAAVTVIEWPDLLPADLREGAFRIEMTLMGDTDRSIILHAEGTRWSSAELVESIESALRTPTAAGE
ncbi:MAG TPA: tRNA (adenosine(37)-N6)-threonylcarbamoyltransferase complex ATPase subunit type 1 TsaE [Chloroflexota bacterium]